MKPSIIPLLTSIVFLQGVSAAESVQLFEADKNGAVAMTGAATHVVSLVNQIKRTDMKGLLLSEEKGSQWRVTKVRVIDKDLVSISFSDGNGAEDVLFDRVHEQHWTIIRRVPIGDWKPKKERRGDRLTQLPLQKP